MKRKTSFLALAGLMLAIATVSYLMGHYDSQNGSLFSMVPSAAAKKAEAAKNPDFSPTRALSSLDVYYPGSESLAPDEMRVVALGTGMPTARPKQAAACFLVELGNGDKFLFDIGYGSVARLSAMKIPMDYLDKVFIGHLHMDHFGDLDALWIGGTKMNRTVPLRVWGPSGPSPEFGTKYAMDGLTRMLHWDAATLAGLLDLRGERLEVFEFDYKGVNRVIYQENGVTIRSIPAVHTMDGSVSFILEWNGLKFAYSSDTFPNKWWIEHTKGVDISVHECFATPQILLDKQNYRPEFALTLSAIKHTSPMQFGKVMAMTQPRLAVGYHFFNDHDTLPMIYSDVRKTYDGPLALATDYMVFNVTKKDIRVRMAAIDEAIWPLPPTRPKKTSGSMADSFSDFIKGGSEWMPETLEQIWADFNQRNGTDYKVPLK